MSNWRQAIVWTNADLIHRRIYAALGGWLFSMRVLWALLENKNSFYNYGDIHNMDVMI